VTAQGWVDEAVQFVGGFIGGAGMLVTELLKTADPPSPLKGQFGLPKRLAWSTPVALTSVKAIGAQYGAKVNDVLAAAVTGALRTYLKQRGTDVNHTTLRAMVPVDLRTPGHAEELGNAFGLVILDLPVTSARPEQRLALTKARMDALKHSPEANATNLLMNLLGRGPKMLEDIAEQMFGSKVSLVLTNVIGPQKLVSLTGVPIDRMMFWVPHPGDEIGLGVSFMSYRGSVTVALETDAQLVPDPQHITEAFTHEFDALLATASPATARKTVHKPIRKRGKKLANE
jgi:WS/DGAT/MGAT family acyltransferase